MKELHIADRKVKRMKEEQRPADFLVVLFEKFMTVLKLVFLGTLLSGIVLAEKISEWMDIRGMYTKLTSFFSEISDGVVNFFKSIDWASAFQNHIGDLVNFISFGMFTKKDAVLIVEGAGNFTSGIMHRFGEVLMSAAKILKEHLETLGRFLAIDVLGVDYEEMDRQKKERNSAVELSESLKKDNDTLDAEMKSLQDKRNMLNDKKAKREKDAAELKAKQAEEEAKKKETVGDKLKRVFTPKEAVVEEKPIKVSTGAAGFGLTAQPTAAAAPTPTPTKLPDDIKQNITKQDKKAEETTKPKPADAKSSGDEGMQYPTSKGQAVVTSKYGMRMHPVKKELKLHTGLDYAGVPENAPIQLVSSAKVQRAGEQNGYCNMIDA
jgi:murein DD-endopeptidase MepM/ murein hydrolase activator NlpD